MKRNIQHLLLLSFILFSPFSNAQVREIVELKSNWKFAQGPQKKAVEINFDDSKWETVSIPHDWAITGPFIENGDGNTGKLPWKGEAWYRLKLEIPESFKDKKIFLLCDGMMSFPEIYLNGKLAGKWDYGYNSFYIDLTEFVKFNDNNILAVHLDTRKHDSRWYPGAGIFRKVQLIALNDVYVNIWGTQIVTPISSLDEALVQTKTTITNSTKESQEIKLLQTIIDSKGNQVAVHEKIEILSPQIQKSLEAKFKIKYPILWDLESPYLYKLISEIYIDNKVIDSYSSTFGIREIEITANDGMHLNGERIQLKGVNLHHDLGPLGAAFNKRALERQLEIMKNMGCNAIRTSHNVAAPELLEMCDEMGLLVFNEIFDKYDGKADITDTTNFEEFVDRNIRNFVTRDRNHPSVFIWSVGNEIGDVQWNIDSGFYKLETMVNKVREYDNTRPTTLVCDSYESAKLRHFDYYDVHSWNYGRRYRLARELEPNKPVIISESASTLSTRGFYEFPLPELKTDFTRSLQVSSYDLNAPEWAEISDDDFMWQQQEPYIAGEFVWTGFDYLGEPTPYNNDWTRGHGMTDKEASRSSYFGIVDLCGIPKDRYYLYKSYWKPEETTIHILPHWNWEERIGQITPVFVYTNGDCAELFLNGKSQGKQCKKPDSENSVERFRLMWKDVIYEPGELKAVAYNGGKKIGESTVKTAGKPYQIKLTADKRVIQADGSDLSYILIEAIDSEGNLCPLADDKITISLAGEGYIAGVGNGNPQSFNSFKSNSIPLFYGKAILIIGSGNTAGNAIIEASADGLLKAQTMIKWK